LHPGFFVSVAHPSYYRHPYRRMKTIYPKKIMLVSPDNLVIDPADLSAMLLLTFDPKS
jgi:hypothetical protein